jgi:peptidyl-prolyl cis-trans isomerase B (cyclophilin B)
VVTGKVLHRILLLGLVLGASTLVRAQKVAAIIVVETSKGTFSFETYPGEAPVTVAHVVNLVASGFYNGQRVHRALPGFVMQFGDPQTRDLSKRDVWGRGQGAASGKVVGVAEIVAKRTHRVGAVSLAHQGDPSKGDSQIFVTLANRRDLDGRYAVFGQVIDGDDVPASLETGDLIIKVSLKP